MNARTDGAQDLAAILQQAQAKHGRGDIKGAIVLYRQAIKILPRHAELIQQLGAAYLQIGEFADAESWLSKAAKLNPASAGARANLGVAYRRLGRPKDAVQACLAAIKIDPTLANAHYNLARAYFDLEDFEPSIAAIKRAVALAPHDPEIWTSLGAVTYRTAAGDPLKWREALTAYDRALQLDPTSTEANAGIGNMMLQKGWARVALSYYDRAIAGGRADKVRYMRAGANLLLGRVGPGLDDYDFRFDREGPELVVRRATPPPYWQGEDLSGKHIYVWSEQGLGDQIVYANCLPDVIRRAGRVTIESKPRLTEVFERSFPDAKVVGRRTEKSHVAAPRDADVQIALASIGRFLRRDLSDFPMHNGYLKPDPVATARIRGRYRDLAGGRRIVGVSWRSRNIFLGDAKSSDLLGWRDILTADGAWFVNMQYGDCDADIAEVKDKLGVEVFQDREIDPLDNLDSSFAQAAALDLMISTSNTAVHIAGSIGIPTWVLLPRIAGTMWYWFLDRRDSPWYPSVRLYRESHDAPVSDLWWRPIVKTIGVDFRGWLAAPRLDAAHG